MSLKPQLTFEDLKAYLNECAPKANECPICSAKEWTILYVHQDGAPLEVASIYGLGVLNALDGSADLSESILGVLEIGMPVVPISCNKCGYIRMFRAAHIATWKSAQIAKSESAPPPVAEKD